MVETPDWQVSFLLGEKKVGALPFIKIWIPKAGKTHLWYFFCQNFYEDHNS